jgi:hypothetical protein
MGVVIETCIKQPGADLRFKSLIYNRCILTRCIVQVLLKQLRSAMVYHKLAPMPHHNYSSKGPTFTFTCPCPPAASYTTILFPARVAPLCRCVLLFAICSSCYAPRYFTVLLAISYTTLIIRHPFTLQSAVAFTMPQVPS